MRKSRRVGVVKIYFRPENQGYEAVLEVPDDADATESKLLKVLSAAIQLKVDVINKALRDTGANVGSQHPSTLQDARPSHRPFYRPSTTPPAQMVHVVIPPQSAVPSYQ